jgi:hypothetical protein
VFVCVHVNVDVDVHVHVIVDGCSEKFGVEKDWQFAFTDNQMPAVAEICSVSIPENIAEGVGQAYTST